MRCYRETLADARGSDQRNLEAGHDPAPCPPASYFFTAAAPGLSLVFAVEDFLVPFLLFFTVDFDAAVEELCACVVAGAAAGLAAVCAAKVKGSEAAVRAI